MPYHRNSNIIDEDDNDDYDSNINFPEKNLTPTQKFLLSSGNTKKDVTNALNNVKGELEMVRMEKPKVKKKVKFTDNVNIMFPEIREIVNDELTKNEEKKIKLSISNVDIIFSELNKGNIPQELKFFTGGDKLLDQALKRFGHLNASNRDILNYLSSPSGEDLLQRNKVKIHLESDDIFINDNNSKESIYYFLSAQEDNTKFSMEIEYTGLEDWRFYINDYLANITYD